MTTKKTYTATLPPFSTWTEVRQVLETEANTRPIPVTLARICHEAILEFIANHDLFAKHGITPPTRIVK